MSSNTTTTTTKPQTALVWLVDYSAPTIETEAHDAVSLPSRDRDGKFAPKFEKPVTKRQAWKKLEASSRKAQRAANILAEMENW